MADEELKENQNIDSDQIIELSKETAIVVDNTIKNDENSTKIDGEILVINDSNLTKSENVIEQEKVNFNEITSDIEIKFSNESIANLYKLKFIKFINTFIELEINSEDNLTLAVNRDKSLDVNDWVVVDETVQLNEIAEQVQLNELSPSKKRKKKSKSKRELFVVDANPSIDTTNTYRYTSKFVIGSDGNMENPTESNAKQTCFNCDKDHSLKDCTAPKDFVKINAARQKFNLRFNNKSIRYHVDEEQKYNHITPGKISNDLRHALGLRKYEIPHYIYLMRRLGYPPGWLEEAKIVHSNLSMYDFDGNNVGNAVSRKQALDPTKVVEYSGFNVPLNKESKDDYRSYGVPPYSDDFSKEAMLKYFEKQFAKEEDNLETCDMDIDDNEIDSSQEINSVGYEVKSKQLKHLKEEDEASSSPSLNELELQKRQLLDELNDTTNSTTAENSKSVTVNDVMSNNCQLSPQLNKSLTVTYGTPILKSSSQYYTLPDPDNFSKDVSPVINFENLPNSTGKYEQMTDILQKVRSTLKKVQNCEL